MSESHTLNHVMPTAEKSVTTMKSQADSSIQFNKAYMIFWYAPPPSPLPIHQLNNYPTPMVASMHFSLCHISCIYTFMIPT